MTQNGLFSSFRFKLVLLVLLVVMPMGAVAFYLTDRHQRLTVEKVFKNEAQIARLVAANLERYIEGVQEMSSALSHLEIVRRREAAACNELFARLMREYPQYANIAAGDAEGNFFASGVPMEGPFSAADRHWYQEMMRTGKFSFGEYQIGRITRKASINCSLPIKDAEGKITGFVMAALDLAWLNETLAKTELPPDSVLTVADHKGVLLARTPDPERWVGRKVADSRLMRTILRQREGQLEEKGFDGIERLYAFTQIQGTNRGRMFVTLGIPRQVVLAGATKAFRTSFFALGGALLLGLLAAGCWAELFLQKPVRRLLKVAHEIGEGNLNVRSGPPYAKGEIGQLARALDEMSASLAQQQTYLMQQERMRALGQMASGIAHDFNNSLTAILGFTEVMLQEPAILKDPEKVRQFLDKINLSAKDAAAIVQRLREFYRTKDREENFRPVDLNDLVEQTVGLTEPRWKNQLHAHIQIRVNKGNIPRIMGNEADLREALTNLIFNAVDAMPSGGTLTLATRQEGGNAVLEVADTGVGMSPEARQHCFEPFYTTKGEKGTGLGLAMVYGVVQRHDASIEIGSAPGKGTVFRIRFPAAIPKPEPTPSAAPAAGAKKIPALRVMLVEDEEPVREVITQYLRHDGHSVLPLSDGQAALEKFKPGGFDLIISDGGLPGISGQRLAELLKKEDQTTPIILLTGYGDYLIDRGERLEGVDMILSKPISLMSLREAMRKILTHPH